MWQLTGTLAELTDPRLTARLDVAAPENGLALSTIDRQPAEPHHILQLHLPPDVVGDSSRIDTYIRDEDLVATYLESPAAHWRAEVYWRWLNDPRIPMGFELILSAQTSLLDCDAGIRVSTSFGEAELRELQPGSFLVRPKNGSTSYCELVHPSDYRRSEFETNDGVSRVTHHLFGESLEKGVIRRSRIRAHWFDRNDDEQSACEALERFRQSPAPLTT